MCSLREAEDSNIESDAVTGAGWNEELLVGSSNVNDSLKEMAAIGRYASLDVSRILSECLESRSAALRQVIDLYYFSDQIIVID